MTVKEHVVDNQKVHFKFYRDNILFYETEKGLVFEVPISDTGNGVFLPEDKALFFMRWIRHQIEKNEKGKQECSLVMS